MSFLDRIKNWLLAGPRFVSEVKAELKKVSFPSRDEVFGTTIVVIITSVIFAVFLWLADIVIVQLFKLVGTRG